MIAVSSAQTTRLHGNHTASSGLLSAQSISIAASARVYNIVYFIGWCAIELAQAMVASFTRVTYSYVVLLICIVHHRVCFLLLKTCSPTSAARWVACNNDRRTRHKSASSWVFPENICVRSYINAWAPIIFARSMLPDRRQILQSIWLI